MKRILVLLIILTMSLSVVVFADGEALAIETRAKLNIDTTKATVTTTNVEFTATSVDAKNMDIPKPIICPRPLFKMNKPVFFNGEKVEYDVIPHQLNGNSMLPLRFTLEAMGYEVIWVQEEFAIDIHKGAHWTRIYIGENEYTKNRMASIKLSSAPLIIEGRTLVPIEFFSEILSIGLEENNDEIVFLTK